MDPKTMAIPIVLKGPNYILWARAAKMIICSRGLWSHVVSPPPPQDEKADGSKVVTLAEGGSKAATLTEDGKWYREDQMVMVILTASLDPTIQASYPFCDTAKELWDTLKRVFGNITNTTRVFEIKKTLSTLTQEDMEFNIFFGKRAALWAELDILQPISTDMEVLNERRDQDKVFGLLAGLNPIYNDLVKHILRTDKTLSVDDVCAQIQKEQGNFGMVGDKKELPTANKIMYKREEKKRPTCEHCKKTGHNKDKCWILHPHLKPTKFQKESRVNLAHDEESQGSVSYPREEKTMVASTSDAMKKADLETIMKAINSLMESQSGISFFTHKSTKDLVVDSGASHHMISNRNLLGNIKPALGNVLVANGKKVPIQGRGSLNIFNRPSDAFYMPHFTSNLLSVKRITSDLNCYAIFGPNDVWFQDIESGKIICKGGTRDDLYVLEDSPSNNSIFSLFSSNLASGLNSVWHARLGHPHSRALSLIMPNVCFDNSSCEACILGKHCKNVFPNSSTIYEKCFDLIHSDVWTSPCVSRDNLKYFVTFIDEKSKYTWITLLPTKDRVFDAFIKFQNYVTNQFNAKIKVLRSDNGGEYTSTKFKDHLSKHGILHQTSCPYTPQQNGIAERKNRHLMEVARSMMFHMKVPKRYWGDAVMTACYLINRIPTKVLQDVSPYEVLNGSKPFINHLKVFGCVCFVLIPGEQRSKLDAKSTRCMFLGYSTTQKGYKCFDPSNNRSYVSRDVKFLEEQSYFDKEDWEGLKNISNSTSDRAASLEFILNHLGQPNPMEPQGNNPTNLHKNVRDTQTEGEERNVGIDPRSPMENSNNPETHHEELRTISEESSKDTAVSVNEGENLETQETSQPVLRRSTRTRKDPSNWVNTRVYYNNEAVAHPTQAVCSLNLVTHEHKVFTCKLDLEQIPKTYEEAKESEIWRGAVKAETSAMEKNHTWDEAELPPGKKAVSSRWIFTIKYKSNGEVERPKARLVARGFTQTYGEDYTDTFAPVAKLHTVRVVLSLATNLSWELWQMDVKNAFLQGELDEEVYMYPPPGLDETITPGKVLRLRKAIYGLKQSPRAWYHKLSMTLRDRGFRRSEADHTLFTLQSNKGIVVVLIYVDDLIISGNDKDGISSTKTYLKSIFDIKDLGELKYFLGIEVCRSPEGLFLSQRKYTLDLLNETGTIGSKPAKTPLEDGYKVSRKGEQDDEPFTDVFQYRRIVGKLIYLTITRPDLCFAINQVSQHMQKPTMYHWRMVDRILRYLKGSSDQGVWMGKNDNTEIVGYCDADWAGDRIDRKSTTGYCTFVGGNLVTWKTKKQKIVSCSSAESEYRAMRKLTNELTWLKALLKDLGIESKDPITMHCDNQAAIHIASNSVFHERTKHIEVDCHKVREKILEGVILPCYTKSEDQLADIFTKAASLKVCDKIYPKLGLVTLSHA